MDEKYFYKDDIGDSERRDKNERKEGEKERRQEKEKGKEEKYWILFLQSETL